METSQFNNNEKEQRIQELFEQSIEKCDRAVKKQKWLTIPTGIILACLVFFAWFPFTQSIATQSIVIRVCGAACVMLLSFISAWLTNRFNSRMSNARDVNELLRVNDMYRKKLAIYSTILLVAFFAIIFGFEYLAGTMKHYIFIAILWIVLCVMCYITTSRDCREVREIKELMGEK